MFTYGNAASDGNVNYIFVKVLANEWHPNYQFNIIHRGN
jgi:hypothetical protein